MKKYSLFFILLLSYFSFAQTFSQEESSRKTECKTNIVCESKNVNLGTFSNGTSNNSVPGIGGTNNYIIYYVTGNDIDEYYLNIELENSIKIGEDYVTINDWDVFIEDAHGSFMQKMSNSVKINNAKIRNKKVGNSDCEAISKITIFINTITVGNNVSNGILSFNLHFSLTEAQ